MGGKILRLSPEQTTGDLPVGGKKKGFRGKTKIKGIIEASESPRILRGKSGRGGSYKSWGVPGALKTSQINPATRKKTRLGKRALCQLMARKKEKTRGKGPSLQDGGLACYPKGYDERFAHGKFKEEEEKG